MRKKNIIIIAFAALLIIFLGVSCNDDPRVAPTRLFIVNDPEMSRGFTYDENGMRVLYLYQGEIAHLEGYINRGEDIGELTWSSSDPSSATIDPDSGMVKALYKNSEVVVMTAVTADGRVKAVAYVIVLIPGEPLPGDEVGLDPNVRLELVFPALSEGFVLNEDGSLTTPPLREDELGTRTFRYAVSYDPGPQYEIQKYTWYLGDKVVYEGLESTVDIAFPYFGYCNLYVVCNVAPAGTNIVAKTSSSVDIMVIPAN